MLASWAELVPLLLQQRQQQRSRGRGGDCLALLATFQVMGRLLKVWTEAMLSDPSEAPTLVQGALPLLRQLHCYSRLFLSGTAAAAARHSRGEGVLSAYNKVQLDCGLFVEQLCGCSSSSS